MVLKKALNNNAVIAVDEKGKECVVFGGGIAFAVKKNEMIPENQIERVFYQSRKDEGVCREKTGLYNR